MTNSEKLIAVKKMCGETLPGAPDDDIISVYLQIAAAKILNRAYPYSERIAAVPTRYEQLQCEIAAYMWNKRGAEGETAHSENGINRSYENADVPASMLNQITPFVGVI